MWRPAQILPPVTILLSIAYLIAFHGIHAAGEALLEESRLLQSRP
jgi:hypothetical protein